MTFIDKILYYDKELFQYLNGLGNEHWDTFWLYITQQFTWIPLFALMLYLVIKAYGWKKGFVFVLIVAVMITFSDQFVNVVKNYFARLRPNNDPTINTMIRILKRPHSYSFVSGHSTTSFAVTTFMILILKKHFKYIVLLIIWPLLFAYSRVYIGVHYPIDIFIGMLLGILFGIIFYKLSLAVLKKLKFVK